MKLYRMMKSFPKKSKLRWKVVVTVLLFVFYLALLTIEWKIREAWNIMVEKRDTVLMLRIATLSIGMLIAVAFRQIWRKSDEEDDKDSVGNKWKMFWQVTKTLTIALCFAALLAVWPNVALGVGLTAVLVVSIIKR